MRILITEFMDLPAVARLQASHEVSYQPDLVDKPAKLLAAAQTCDAIIVRNRTKVSLCGNCLRITVGTKNENNELLGALRKYSGV